MQKIKIAGFNPINSRDLYKIKKYQLYSINWKYIKVTKRYIFYCKLIGLLYSIFSFLVLDILLILVK